MGPAYDSFGSGGSVTPCMVTGPDPLLTAIAAKAKMKATISIANDACMVPEALCMPLSERPAPAGYDGSKLGIERLQVKFLLAEILEPFLCFSQPRRLFVPAIQHGVLRFGGTGAAPR